MKGCITQKGTTYSVVVDIGKDKNNKRKQKWFSGFKTKKEAQTFMNKKLVELESNDYVYSEKISVSNYLDNWINKYVITNLSKTTIDGYVRIIDKHIKPIIGHIELQKLKPIHIQELYDNKLKEGRLDENGGLNAKSVIGIHRVLRKALNQAYKLQIISKNPADCIELPKPKRYYPKLLADEDIERFIKAFSETDIYIPVMLSLMLGLRRGETLGLRWQDVGWDNNILYIRQSLLPTKNGLIFGDVKTDSSHRDIPVSEHVITMLKEYKVKQNEYRKYFDKAYIDYDLISCKKDGSPYNPGTYSHMFRNILLKNNIPKMRFHDLRHTNATLMLKNNVSAKIASSRLGHATTAITLDLYSHVLPDMHKEVNDKLDDVFFK